MSVAHILGWSSCSAFETVIRSPEHNIPGLLSTLKYIFAETKNVIKNMRCGHSRDDTLHAAHRVSGPCSPARSSRPSRTGGHPSAPSQLSVLQIGGEPHAHRDASLLSFAPRTQTGAPPRSSVLHIREPSVERGVTDICQPTRRRPS